MKSRPKTRYNIQVRGECGGGRCSSPLHICLLRLECRCVEMVGFCYPEGCRKLKKLFFKVPSSHTQALQRHVPCLARLPAKKLGVIEWTIVGVSMGKAAGESCTAILTRSYRVCSFDMSFPTGTSTQTLINKTKGLF